MNNFFRIIAIIIIGIIQISFLTTWPWPVNSLNLVLSLAIFLTVIVNYSRGLYFSLFAGLFLELYTSLPFGITTLSLLITVVVVNLLFNNFFTNRSLYSIMLLGVIGTFGHNLIISGFSFFSVLLGFENYFYGFDFWTKFIWQPFLNLIILAIIFFAYHLSTDRLKNIFLFSPNSYETRR